MQQHGLVDYASKRRLPIEPRTKREEEPKALKLWDLMGAFILYGIFFGISLITLIIEILWHHSHRAIERHKSRKLLVKQ